MIKLFFQNKDYIVVDKPFGISVHNNEEPENLLSTLEKQLSVAKLYPVHRLDKETSGVQILALNELSARTLAEEFQKKTVEKKYLGVLRGQLKQNSGIWNQSLTDKSEGRKNPAGPSANRIACETRFEVLKSSKYFSQCQFNLITGRQHQIRKHAALHNHAIVGDARYGDINYNKKISSLYKTDRMFLHCHKINLFDLKFESAMPLSFAQLFDTVANE